MHDILHAITLSIHTSHEPVGGDVRAQVTLIIAALIVILILILISVI
jgi:hypothetical protein